MRSAQAVASRTEWDENRMARPRERASATIALKSRAPPGSRPESGSSRIQAGASTTRICASSRRRIIPLLRVRTRFFAAAARPNRARVGSIAPRRSRGAPWIAIVYRSDSSGVRCSFRTGVSRTTPRRRRTAGRRGSPPRMATVPVRGSRSPVRILSRVVFPAPFSPSSATTSPGAMERERSAIRGVS